MKITCDTMRTAAVVLLIAFMMGMMAACGGGQTSTQAPSSEVTPPSAAQPSTTPSKTEPVRNEPVTETPRQKPTTEKTPAVQPEESAEEPSAPRKNYTNPKKFSIEGKWKNVGEYTFGQVQSGSIVVFDGTNCNVFSPQDTYAFYKDGDSYRLDCTSLFFSETLSFTVKIVDKEHIDIYYGSDYLELSKVD